MSNGSVRLEMPCGTPPLIISTRRTARGTGAKAGRKLRGPALVMVLIALVLGSSAIRARVEDAWVPSWTASLYEVEPEARLTDEQLTDATLRQAVRLSVGGDRIRLVLSNAAGDRPLAISGVHVALSGSQGTASIDPQSDREVDFGGRPDVEVPAGGDSVSDAVNLRVPPLARLSISMYFATPPTIQTGHLRSLSSSWLGHGNQLAAATISSAVSIEHWYQLSAVQVEASKVRTIVAFGDSITDGSGSTVNGNNRWPDLLAERLQASPVTNRWAVSNQGLAGNRLLAEGRGPRALARFEHDALSQPHVRTVVLLEGINDLGHLAKTTPQPAARRAIVRQIIGAYRQIVARAHAHRVRVIGVTLLPFIGSDYLPTPSDEPSRRAINEWIRTPGHFDAVFDWDAVVRDPGNPSRFSQEFDSGDHLHPSQSGYRAMVDSVPMAEIVK